MQNSDTFIQPVIIKFNDENAVKQEFSLPSSTIYYLKTYPSTFQTYLKLIKTCKYFYSKNSAVPVNGIYELRKEAQFCALPFDRLYSISILDKIQNYWIFGTLYLIAIPKNIFKKVYRSDITHLLLEQYPLTFEEFKILTSSKKLKMFTVDVPIKYENGDIVTFGTVIEYLPYATYLEYSDPTLINSVENIIEFVKQLNKNVKTHSRWLQKNPDLWDRSFTSKLMKVWFVQPLNSEFEKDLEIDFMLNFFDPTLDENAIKFHLSKNGLPEKFWRRYNRGWHMLIKDCPITRRDVWES